MARAAEWAARAGILGGTEPVAELPLVRARLVLIGWLRRPAGRYRQPYVQRPRRPRSGAGAPLPLRTRGSIAGFPPPPVKRMTTLLV